MREILFRGLHRRRGEKVHLDGTPVESMWVYGGYCQYNEERGIIYQTEPEIHKFPVYADSIGQFTGLTDKNGTKIFEGDILKHRVMYSEGKDIKREDQIFTVRYSVEQTRFLAYLPNGVFNPTAMQDCEVIGNVHDNPEMWEKEEEI